MEKGTSIKGGQITRILLLLLAACVLVGTFSSCEVTEKVLYDNFMSDYDVQGRFDDFLSALSRKQTGGYFQSQIEHFQQDLSSMDIQNEKIIQINNEFIKATEYMLIAIDALNDENQELYEKYNELAQNTYYNGIALLEKFKREEEKRQQAIENQQREEWGFDDAE